MHDLHFNLRKYKQKLIMQINKYIVAFFIINILFYEFYSTNFDYAIFIIRLMSLVYIRCYQLELLSFPVYTSMMCIYIKS